MSEKEFHNLDNAVGLVEMLEFLIGNFSEQSLSDSGTGAYQEVPWKGMKLTLERLRVMLVEARRSVPQDSVSRDAVSRDLGARRGRPVEQELPEEDAESESPLPDALANRIQMAPLPRQNRRGYSRELGAGQTSKSQETVRVDS